MQRVRAKDRTAMHFDPRFCIIRSFAYTLTPPIPALDDGEKRVEYSSHIPTLEQRLARAKDLWNHCILASLKKIRTHNFLLT